MAYHWAYEALRAFFIILRKFRAGKSQKNMRKEDDYSDMRFIIGILQKDEAILRKIYREFFPRILAFVRKKGGGREEAYEVINDAIMTIHGNPKVREEDFVLTSSFYGYLFGVCKMMWLRKRHSKKRETKHISQEVYDKEISNENNPESLLISKELYENFKERFRQLSEKCQKIIRLRYFEKSPYKDISKNLNIGENAAMKRFERCKEKFDELLNKLLN